MTNSNKEIELKYLVSRQCSSKKLARKLRKTLTKFGFEIDASDKSTLHDVYYDGDTNELERAGWTLRLRADHNSNTLTLKSTTATSGLFRRTELEETFPRKLTEAKDQLHIPVKSRIGGYMKDLQLPISMLNPAYRHVNRRHRKRITHPSTPETSIQWSIDKIESAGTNLSYVEFEFELERGSESILAHLRLIADTTEGLYPSRMSKSARGTYAHQPERYPQAQPFTLLPNWQTQANTLVKPGLSYLVDCEPFAYEAVHPEGVHQLRVAIRRTSATLNLIGVGLPAQVRQNIDAQLAQLMKSLGKVRDNDVHRAQVSAYLNKKTWRAYKRFLDRSQQDNQRSLREMLDANFANLKRDLANLVANVEKFDGENSEIAAPAAKTDIQPALKAAQGTAETISPYSSNKDLHRFRIEIKQLRYQLEFLVKIDERAEDLILQTSNLQRILGHLQDSRVACAKIKKYLRGKSKAEKAALNRFVAKQKALAKKGRGQLSKASVEFISSARNNGYSQHPSD